MHAAASKHSEEHGGIGVEHLQQLRHLRSQYVRYMRQNRACVSAWVVIVMRNMEPLWQM